MFGMGTGDPSQYGHRQTYRGIEFLRFRSGFRLKAHALKSPQLEWRLAGGCPQPAATSALSRMDSPGPCRNADCNLAPKKLLEAVLQRN